MNNVFRFHAAPGGYSEKIRRLSKRKPKSIVNPHPLAADSEFLKDENGRWPIDAYADLASDQCITLTQKEADLIALANPGVRPPLALEALHPWLRTQSYTDNCDVNFDRLMATRKRYGRQLVTAGSYSDLKWNTVCNSVGLKTDLDARFFTAWHLPIQDVYLLEEGRRDRVVIAIDFNAMYPSCMMQNFPKPSRMRRVVYNREIGAGEALPVGLYRCKLQYPKPGFIQKYNPFRTFFAGKYLRPVLSEGLMVDLNEFEIPLFARFFEKISVVDAIVADKVIRHPLAREAKRCFSRREHYLANGNMALADREKYLSLLLASCTSRPERSCANYESRALAEDFLRSAFGIALGNDDPSGLSASWLQGKKTVAVYQAGHELHCCTPGLTSGRACFMFNQRIVARSRIVLLAMMEKISRMAPKVEICYANVDSIHISVRACDFDCVNSTLRAGASTSMGGYKIEAIAEKGLWLEPGRYWLYSDRIKKFKNRSIRHRGAAFEDNSVFVINRKIGNSYIPVKFSIRMDQSMSDLRSIKYDPIDAVERQHLVEVRQGAASAEVLDALEFNRRYGIPYRMRAFRRVARTIGVAGTRCLETQQQSQTQLEP